MICRCRRAGGTQLKFLAYMASSFPAHNEIALVSTFCHVEDATSGLDAIALVCACPRRYYEAQAHAWSAPMLVKRNECRVDLAFVVTRTQLFDLMITARTCHGTPAADHMVLL
jgi:hypothetical protein